MLDCSGDDSAIACGGFGRRAPAIAAASCACSQPTSAPATTRSSALRRPPIPAAQTDVHPQPRTAPLRHYLRSLSGRNRRPRAGSGGGPREALCEVVHDVEDVKTSINLPRPRTDRKRTVDAAVVALARAPPGSRGVIVSHRAGPSDLSWRRRPRLPGLLSSLKDARAAGFLAPVAPLTFPLRCSRLMSFLSYVVGASPWRG